MFFISWIDFFQQVRKWLIANNTEYLVVFYNTTTETPAEFATLSDLLYLTYSSQVKFAIFTYSLYLKKHKFETFNLQYLQQFITNAKHLIEKYSQHSNITSTAITKDLWHTIKVSVISLDAYL